MCVYVCGYTHGGVRVDKLVRGQLVGADSLLSLQGPGERTLVIMLGGKCISAVV